MLRPGGTATATATCWCRSIIRIRTASVSYTHLKHLFHFSYQRYIINQIRENFGLEHTPIRLVVRERGSGEVGAKDV